MPWAELLAVALKLGIAPSEFWALSLKEWNMLTQERLGGAPLTRQELEALSHAFPDGI